MGVTVSFPSSDLVKSWGGGGGWRSHVGFSSAGLDGGPPNRSVFILARAPLVTEGRVIGVYK